MDMGPLVVAVMVLAGTGLVWFVAPVLFGLALVFAGVAFMHVLMWVLSFIPDEKVRKARRAERKAAHGGRGHWPKMV